MSADLIEVLYRGLADNTVGKIIDTPLRTDLVILDEIGFAPLDDTATQLLFRLVAAGYERRSLAIASHWPFGQWGRFLPHDAIGERILDRTEVEFALAGPMFSDIAEPQLVWCISTEVTLGKIVVYSSSPHRGRPTQMSPYPCSSPL